MKIEITPEFQAKLKRQIIYISQHKPLAAKNLSKLIYSEIRKIGNMSFKHKISKFFESDQIGELMIKGYSIIYEIVRSENKIIVFSFHKWEEELRE